MMSISSPAGRRLAKARAAVLHVPGKGRDPIEHMENWKKFMDAARAVADELIAQGFDRMEGD